MGLMSRGTRLSALCGVLAAGMLLASSGVAAAAPATTAYSSAKAVQIEFMSKEKWLGSVTAEAGSAEAMFDGTDDSYGDTYPLGVEALGLDLVPLRTHATQENSPQHSELAASHYEVDTGTLSGSAAVTDEKAEASGFIAGTKVKNKVSIGRVESSATATADSADASFTVSDVKVKDIVKVDKVHGEVHASLNGESEVVIDDVHFKVLGIPHTLKPGETFRILGLVKVSLMDGYTVKEDGRVEAHGGTLEIEAFPDLNGGATVRIGGLDAVVTAEG